MNAFSWIKTRITEAAVDPGELRSIGWCWISNSLAASHAMPARLRTVIYRSIGLQVAMSSIVRPGVIFRDKNVSIGPGSTINYRCVFDNRVGVNIGRHVGIGIGVVFLNTDHNTDNPTLRAGKSIWGPVTVGDGAFIGSGSTILPGVSVGTGCVIGAGAVVTKDCLPHGLYAGTPAKRVKDLPFPVAETERALDGV
jgi:maltose O-acetyltransferase